MKMLTRAAALATVATLSLSTVFPTTSFARSTVGQGQYETLDFHVINANQQNISGARVICIDPDGKVLRSGITNKKGDWTCRIPLQPDPRFDEAREMGIITAMAVAKGYNESVVFEVPVVNQAQQPITMEPIRPNRRNEPTYALGNLHRHDILKMVDDYAKQLKLKKQPPVAGEQGYSAWGPDIQK
ncbi:hypothetical protein [Alicyclobacillus sp. SO9]|uniref:hypothetical protein n=1 Tax=Alicyclobacillus sp. SO9 TaxID=2665646 RepID=UPI0018E7676A|nr:hypothetical protein [Alicyclobacillus sp. SO9]QQE77693.1 hypothetical protein GI364_17395 [Alicyclobacillus sp. SO9]